MTQISPISNTRRGEQRSSADKEIALERRSSDNFELGFLAICLAGTIGAMVAFLTGNMTLNNQ